MSRDFHPGDTVVVTWDTIQAPDRATVECVEGEHVWLRFLGERQPRWYLRVYGSTYQHVSGHGARAQIEREP